MVGPKTYLNQEEIEKDFLRFQDAMVKEDDKYHNLLTFLTGGTFLASTSIVSFFYSSNNTNDLFFLKVGWVLLVISF